MHIASTITATLDEAKEGILIDAVSNEAPEASDEALEISSGTDVCTCTWLPSRLSTVLNLF